MSLNLRTGGHLTTRAQRRSVQGHPLLWPEWLLALATQYREAARSLPSGEGPTLFWPKYHALGHSVELVLKGFLARKRMTEDELRNLGHHIRPLLKEAMGKGLGLPRRTRWSIALMDDMHAEHWARYPKNHAAPVLVIDQFFPAVDELFETVKTKTGQGWAPWVKI